jgi:hypothetical protein
VLKTEFDGEEKEHTMLQVRDVYLITLKCEKPYSVSQEVVGNRRVHLPSENASLNPV